VWASDKGIITRLAKHTRALAEDNPGRDVNLVYSAMGARSGDFSHMMSDALLGQLEGSPISPKAVSNSVRASAPFKRRRFPFNT